MTLNAVAKVAGVSPSTVSRVVNGHPRVAPQTVKIVNQAIEQLQFKPTRRSRIAPSERLQTPTWQAANQTAVTLMVVGSSGTDLSPGFDGLLRGVTTAANILGVELSIQFFSDPGQIEFQCLKGKPNGYLIHGETPCLDSQTALQRIPCVWLMANRERPAWGDQILPDNSAIGEIAADYLADRGHKQLAICNVDWQSWSMEVRSHAFLRAAHARGCQAEVIDPMSDAPVGQQAMRHSPTPREVVDRLVALSNRPIGLFVAEDRQVMPLYMELRNRGLSIGRDGDIDIISCNNQRAHLVGLDPMPATIDIRIESIGYRGLELLLTRVQNAGGSERVRTLIDPSLVSPTTLIS